MQPGAKINSVYQCLTVYYCENVLEQSLLPCSNSPYLEQRLRVQAGRSAMRVCVPFASATALRIIKQEALLSRRGRALCFVCVSC